MMWANEEEKCSEWLVGMMICFSWKSLWKVEECFLEDEKKVLTLSSFFLVVYFFVAEGSVHDAIDNTVRILGKNV